MTDFRKEAEQMNDELIRNRRTVHELAETGMDLPRTKSFVMATLKRYGIEPQPCGRSGVTAVIGQGGRVLLLRGDMDALPMAEQSGLPFAATNGNAHSCGHDMHTSMLLGAARLLKAHEAELRGRVKLMFQPGEEVLGGAADMIQAGLLEDPHVDAAIGMHTSSGGTHSALGLIAYKKDYATFSGDMIRVTVKGHQAHGSTPECGVDAISAAAHIITGLEELISREVSNTERSIVLVGKITGGDSCNTEAGTCVLEISVRAASAERRQFLKQRVREISEGIALAFRATAVTEFVYGMPPLYNDPSMYSCVPGYCAELLGRDMVTELDTFGGTEDFTAVAEKVPSIYLNIGTGSLAGADISHHNPKIIFDERALPIGAAVYAYCAMRYLEDHH